MPGGFSYLANFKTQDSDGQIISQSVGTRALLSTCADADSIEVDSSTGKLEIKDAGTSKANGVSRDKMGATAGFWLTGALAQVDSGGGVFSLENTYSTNLLVDRVIIYVTTPATDSSCELDIGPASGATTSSATLIDGLDVNAAAGAFDNIDEQGDGGASMGLWESSGDNYVTASVSAGASAGLVGFYGVHCISLE